MCLKKTPDFHCILGDGRAPPEGTTLFGDSPRKESTASIKGRAMLVSTWQRRNEDPNIHLQIITDADYDTPSGFLQRILRSPLIKPIGNMVFDMFPLPIPLQS